ncbi:MAG: bacterioferritin [Pseudomonadota bacterium]
MAKSSQVIEVLNEALAEEIIALNQYFLHAELCEHWGFEALSKHIKKQSIDEMKHAEKLMERLLFLGGMPKLETAPKLKIGRTIEEIFANDHGLEEMAIASYNKWIGVARTADDNGTRLLLEEILKDEENHIDWLGTQLDVIKQVGLQNYLTKQLEEAKA